MFEEVTKREGGKRAAQRGAWLVGSTALQSALIAGIIVLSAAVAKRAVEGPIVPVKIVRQATPAAPPPPPPPPARKAPPRTTPKKVEAKPRQAMIQPKEMPQELKAPETTPPEPEEDTGEGVEGGVVGGVAGGVVGGAPAPPPQPQGPLKFNSTMAPPVAVAGPNIEYTPQALEHEVEGTMLVECIVSIDGTVHDCRVLKSLPFMDRAVVGTLERRRYKPATLGGKPVEVQYVFTLKFKLPQ